MGGGVQTHYECQKFLRLYQQGGFRQCQKFLSFFLWLPIDKSDDYEIIRGTLLLFVPFRNEHSEITSKGEASCRIIKIMKFAKNIIIP